MAPGTPPSLWPTLIPNRAWCFGFVGASRGGGRVHRVNTLPVHSAIAGGTLVLAGAHTIEMGDGGHTGLGEHCWPDMRRTRKGLMGSRWQCAQQVRSKCGRCFRDAARTFGGMAGAQGFELGDPGRQEERKVSETVCARLWPCWASPLGSRSRCANRGAMRCPRVVNRRVMVETAGSKPERMQMQTSTSTVLLLDLFVNVCVWTCDPIFIF